MVLGTSLSLNDRLLGQVMSFGFKFFQGPQPPPRDVCLFKVWGLSLSPLLKLPRAG